MTRSRAATTPSDALGHSDATMAQLENLPSIRFSTFYDPRANRPSLTFSPIARTLPTGSEVIRVGRYSERDSQPSVPPNVPSAAPVGFKSKVVSRRHCEFWFENGKWYIRDVKSSSGTFLNHIRLSSPGTESRPYAINDGDIVQLGIDFKGGEEMIFRCVKMRLELNRGWQNKLNAFNMNTHKRLRNMTSSSGGGNNSKQSYSQDCSICLNSIAPCQCLFVAPCSHTWHYKCIKALLSSPSYPIFVCPNCRASADLEAEVDDPEEWEFPDSADGQDQDGAAGLQQEGDDAPPQSANNQVSSSAAPRPGGRGTLKGKCRHPRAPRGPHPLPPQQPAAALQGGGDDSDPMDVTMQFYPSEEGEGDGDIDLADADQDQDDQEDQEDSNPPSINGTGTRTPTQNAGAAAGGGGVSHATSPPVPIPAAAAGQTLQARGAVRTPSPDGGGGSNGAALLNGHEGPITPRNDAGPWVFDGSGVRLRVPEAPGGHGAAAAAAAAARNPIASLDATLPPGTRVDGEAASL